MSGPVVVEIIEVERDLVEEPGHVLRPVDRTTDKFKALVGSMKLHGFKRDEPIEVSRSPQGTYVIARKGMHRYNAACEAGLKKVWVGVLDRPPTNSELIAGQVEAEATHTEARPAEFGRAVLAYMADPDNRGKTKVEIARAMGRPDAGFLDKVLKLASLPEPVQDLVDDNLISIGNGLSLVALVRATVPLSEDVLLKAKTEDVAAFQATCSALVQALRAGSRGPKTPPARLRNVADVRSELERSTRDASVHHEYVRALAWCLRQDPVSAAAEGLAPALTGAEATGAALRAHAAQLQAALEGADVLHAAATKRADSLSREVERLNQIIDQRDSVIKALEKGRKPEA